MASLPRKSRTRLDAKMVGGKPDILPLEGDHQHKGFVHDRRQRFQVNPFCCQRRVA